MGSASTTWPLTQNATFDEISSTGGIKYTDIIPQYDHVLDRVTGSVNGATDVAHVLINGVPVRRFTALGVVNSTGTTYGLAQSSTVTLATITAQITHFRFARYWGLDDVCNSSEKEWLPFRCVTTCSLAGVATGASGPVSGTASMSTFTLVLNDVGTIALETGASFKLASFRERAAIGRGGGLRINLAGEYSAPGGATHAIAYTGSTFSWLFPTPDLPPRGVITLDTDGETLNPTVYMNAVSFENPTSRGGAVRVQAQFTVDKA